MKLAIIDLETTGFDPRKHEIIEIGCVVVDEMTLEVIDQFDMKIKPEYIEDADPGAFKVNGYNEEEWKDGITLHQAMMQLYERLVPVPGEKCLFMSYNVTFDWGFFQQALYKTGLPDPFNYHRLDLLTMAYCKIPHSKMQSWRLKSVCAYLRIVPEPKIHRGANGALKAYEVYKKLVALP